MGTEKGGDEREGERSGTVEVEGTESSGDREQWIELNPWGESSFLILLFYTYAHTVYTSVHRCISARVVSLTTSLSRKGRHYRAIWSVFL